MTAIFLSVNLIYKVKQSLFTMKIFNPHDKYAKRK
jgi:hypothetical protein